MTARRLRQGGAGVRARHAARHQLHHRRRRAHARRRLRLAEPQVRPDRRQPDLGRRRDRRRRAGARERRTRTRTCSGRCAAAAATSASSPRSSSGCTPSGREVLAGLIVHPFSNAKQVLQGYRRVVDERAGRAHLLGRDAQGAAAALPADGGPRQGGPRARALLRAAIRRRARARSRRCGRSGSRSRRWSARRRSPAGSRPSTRSSRPGQRNYWKSHDFVELGDAADRPDHRVRRPAAVARVRDLHRAPRRRREPRAGDRHRVSATAT